jgi:Pro-kumamolisin, activation domain/IPT/TIG domain
VRSVVEGGFASDLNFGTVPRPLRYSGVWSNGMTMQIATRTARQRPQFRAALGAALVIAALAGFVPQAAGALSARLKSALVVVGGIARIPDGAVALGPLGSARSVSLGIAIEPARPAALAAYAAAVSTAGNPFFHRYLSASTFDSDFAPSLSTVTRLESSLRAIGFHVGALPADRLLLPVSASVHVVDHALHTNLVKYRLASGAIGWSASVAPELPRSVAAGISSVVGLDDLTRSSTSISHEDREGNLGTGGFAHAAVSSSPGACGEASGAARRSGGWTEADIAQAYGLSGLYAKGDLAAGQTIGIFELEPFLMSDVATFDRCVFGDSHTSRISLQKLDGFDLSGPGEGEAALDVEEISALAPDARILVYEAPNTTFGALDEYAAMVSQDQANVLSTSWGECEQALQVGAPDATQLENTLFEEAAIQGQTVFASAGDDGSDDCANTPFSSGTPVAPYLSVDDPGGQPYVTSVGGTSLLSDHQPLGADGETVWNDGTSGGAGGGGLSSLWSIPAWQSGLGVPGLAASGARETPDVSASANPSHGTTVYISSPSSSGSGQLLLESKRAVDSTGSWGTIGGTSAAAPIWAAVTAEIAGSGVAGTSCAALSITAGGPDLGFLAPELYAVAASEYSVSFNDIVKGDNDVFGLDKGYEAGPGYDLASGLGSPDVTNGSSPGLAAYVCAAATGSTLTPPLEPAIASLSPTSGPAGGGNTLVVQLASALPSGATVQAEIGASRAAVLAASGSTVDLLVPASVVTAAAPAFAGAGPARVTLTVSTPSGTVSTSASGTDTYQYLDESGNARTPTVTGIGPSAGSPEGGNVVTIYGSDLAASPDAVSFGGRASDSVQVLSSSELRVVVPAETSATACSTGIGFYPTTTCQVEVVVTNADGTSPPAAILPAISGPIVFSPMGVVEPTPGTEVDPSATEYDYSVPPVITAVSPRYANPVGGQPVTITGSGFNFDTFYWVNFGPIAATQSEQVKITYLSNTKVRIAPPDGPRSEPSVLRGGVSIQSGGGVSNVERFGYAGVPKVIALSSHEGPTSGGAILRVSATKALGTISVDFVTATGRDRAVQIIRATRVREHDNVVTVRTPRTSARTVNVELCTAAGCSRAAPSRDTYVFGRP